MLVIVVEDPEGRKRKHEFKKAAVTIGRSSNNDLCIEAKGVSRQHARASVQGRRVLIEDLQSTNGTFVNGLFADRTYIEPGDRVSVGEMILAVSWYHDDEEADPIEQWGGVFEGSITPPAQEEPSAVRQGSAIDVDWHWSSDSLEQPPEAAIVEAKYEPVPPEEPAESLSTQGKTPFDDFLVPIWDQVFDPSVCSVVICGTEEVYARRHEGIADLGVRYSEAELRAAALAIARVSGKTIDSFSTVLSADLPDGLAVSILLPPYSQKGIVISISKTASGGAWESQARALLNEGCGDFLAACVSSRKNILVSGPQKGWTLAVLEHLLGFIGAEESVLALEHSEPLAALRSRCVRVNARSMLAAQTFGRQAFHRAVLDLDPDWVLVENALCPETYACLELISAGQCTGMVGVIAGSSLQALARLEVGIAREEKLISLPLVRRTVSSCFDIVIQLSPAGEGFVITSVSELGPYDREGDYDIRPMLMYDESIGQLRWSGIMPSFDEDLRRSGHENALVALEELQ